VLSNGSEEAKGSPEGQEAYALLKERTDINFQGNLEARDVLNGDADVVATDGFSGNTLLKGTEGVAKMMSEMMKSAFKRNVFSKLGYLLSRKGFKDMKETMDYKSVGGAMLLGVNGVVVKAHGNSDGVAIFHAIEVAYSLVKNKLVDQIKEGLSQ
jgi:glycerol-3-phosphate acyltransferase PlsX